MDLEFTISNQLCRFDDKRQQVVNLSENYLVLSFTFTEDWEDTGKFVLYPMEDGTVLRQGINNDKTVVPAEVLTGDKFYFTVYGINNNERITTNLVKVNLLKSGYTDDAITPGEDELTPSVVEEIYLALDEKVGVPTFEGEIEGINNNIELINQELDTKSDAGHKHQVKDITDFPTDVSYFENDADYLVPDDISDKADKSEIPTKVSELTNDAGYLTEHQSLTEYAKLTDLPVNVSELTNDAGYLTEHQSLTEYYTKTEVEAIIHNIENKIQFELDKQVIEAEETLTMFVQVRKDGFPAVNKTVNIYAEDIL